LQFGFTVEDGDGDTSSGSLSISVDDDTPTTGAFETLTVQNVEGATATGTNSDFSSGADGWQSIDITGPEIEGISYTTVTSIDSEGNPVSTLIGFLTGEDPADTSNHVFEFSIEGDGDYSFTLLEAEVSTFEELPVDTVASGNVSFRETPDGGGEFRIPRCR